MSTMTHIDKTLKLCRKKCLAERFSLLSKKEKAYAAYLIRRYGYPVNIAIQRAYVFGFDAFPYDYRTNHATTETLAAADFGM